MRWGIVVRNGLQLQIQSHDVIVRLRLRLSPRHGSGIVFTGIATPPSDLVSPALFEPTDILVLIYDCLADYNQL